MWRVFILLRPSGQLLHIQPHLFSKVNHLGHKAQGALSFFFTFCHKGGVIRISELIDISSSNLDSSLCFIQPGISHDVGYWLSLLWSTEEETEAQKSWSVNLSPDSRAQICSQMSDIKVHAQTISPLCLQVNTYMGGTQLAELEGLNLPPGKPLQMVYRSIYEDVQCSVAQLCLALCSPFDCSPPGSSVHGIFQWRILEWVAISSSRGLSQPRD